MGKRVTPRGQKRAGGDIRTRVHGRAADALVEPESVKEWDMEELERGYRRDKNGAFTGRPPKVIPRSIIDELHRRKFVIAIDWMKTMLPEALEILATIARDPKARDQDRIKACEIIIERILPARIDLGFNPSKEPKFIEALMAAIVPGDPKDDAIEAKAKDAA